VPRGARTCGLSRRFRRPEADAAERGLECLALRSVLSAFVVLRQAAFHCGAHARALLYYETHVRAVRKGGSNIAARTPHIKYSDEEVSFLQVGTAPGPGRAAHRPVPGGCTPCNF
jgi:hypothetical protein